MSRSMGKEEILVTKQSRDLQSLGAKLNTKERTRVWPEYSPECLKTVRGQKEC
jgi:hypothetical protein